MQAQRLKKELAAAKTDAAAKSPSSGDEEETVQRAAKRIDGGDLRRETLAFVGKITTPLRCRVLPPGLLLSWKIKKIKKKPPALDATTDFFPFFLFVFLYRF